jgi:hypothetical protein
MNVIMCKHGRRKAHYIKYRQELPYLIKKQTKGIAKVTDKLNNGRLIE